MVLVIGLGTLLRALRGGSMAVALENVALRHQLAVLQRSGSAQDEMPTRMAAGMPP